MKIQITQEHINEGIRGNGMKCPIALALKEVFQCEDVFAGEVILRVKEKMYPTPLSVLKFMSIFDFFENIEPMEFEL